MKTEFKTVSANKKAYHDFEILEKMEVGIVLTGTEIKAIREGKMNIKESFARIVNQEIWLMGCHINPYSHGNRFNADPLRDRKLLMHRREINKLAGKVKEKGLTLMALSAYFKGGLLKIQLGLCKAKKLYDKRADLKDKDSKREAQRAIGNRF